VRQADILSAFLSIISGMELRWAHGLESLCSGSIFGTAISQARNDFDDDEFRRCILSNTISTSYGTQKIVGTEGA